MKQQIENIIKKNLPKFKNISVDLMTENVSATVFKKPSPR